MLLVAVGCYLGAYFLFSAWQVRPSSRHPFDQVQNVTVVPPTSGSQEEDVLVLVVSAFCGASKDSRLPSAWRGVVEGEAKVASGDGRALRVVGVAVANPAGVGVSFLEDFGPFDEVTSGRGWESMGAMMFLFRDLVGPSAVPQVIKLRRTVTRRAVGGPQIAGVRVLSRWVGVDGILALAKRHPLMADD